jgi:hypothetical protein
MAMDVDFRVALAVDGMSQDFVFDSCFAIFVQAQG